MQILNNLQYKIHLLLHSKYKILTTLILYLLIFYIYNIFIDKYDFVECMKQGSSPTPTPIAPRPGNTIEYILRLEHENAYLKNRIEILERELQGQIDQINNKINAVAELIDNTQNTSVESIQDQSNNNEPDLYPSII